MALFKDAGAPFTNTYSSLYALVKDVSSGPSCEMQVRVGGTQDAPGKPTPT